MENEYPNHPFESYADDIVIHCKTEKQALQLCREVARRFESCKLQMHPTKTKVVNLRGSSVNKYSHRNDFLGYTFKPSLVKTKVGFK